MKLFLFLAFSLLAMIVKAQSGRDKFQTLTAYSALVKEFNTKARKIDSSTDWHSKLEEVFSLPSTEMFEALKKTNANWMFQLSDASINTDELKNSFPAGESSKSTNLVDQEIKSIKDNHIKILHTMSLVMPGLIEPNFEKINEFAGAFTKFEKKSLNKKFLSKVKTALPKFKTKHDELLTEITSNIYGDFVVLRDDYINKLNSLINPSPKYTRSLSNTLTEVKAAQDRFSVVAKKLLQDLETFAVETVKCAAFLLETKSLSLKNNYLLPKKELQEITRKFKEDYNENIDLE